MVFIARITSKIAAEVSGLFGTTADAGNNWHFLGFKGQLEGQNLQAIDHIIIYTRPIPVAQKFADAILQRLQPTR